MPRSSSALARSFGLTATLALGATAALAHADVRAEPAWIWTSEAASPRLPPPNALSESEAGLERLCGRPEAGLREVAARLAERKVLDLPFLDAEGVAQSQRVAGEPHVWPHAWVLSGQTLDHAATRQKLAAWGATFHENGERRCGLASRRGADGTEVIAAVALDALADLSPLPTETHVGTWLSVEARLLVPASGARVVVMGPTGLPRSVPTQLQGGRIRAQLALDRPGAFTVQIVADTAQGPRPVLEAELFADKTPWTRLPDAEVPGETVTPAERTDRGALLAMIEELRSLEQTPPLAPLGRLNALALAHAERMKGARLVGHDVGDGDPNRRFEASDVRARTFGENVAHAGSVLLAHRALYASPSHRTNLLSRDFDHVGIGVVRDEDGSVWVAEEFAGGLE